MMSCFVGQHEAFCDPHQITSPDLKKIKVKQDRAPGRLIIYANYATHRVLLDDAEIPARPDVEEMVRALAEKDRDAVRKNMINVLENFTLKRYPIVVYTKDKMQDMCKIGDVLMSGSGPTVFGLCSSRDEAKRICESMREINRESFWTRTTG